MEDAEFSQFWAAFPRRVSKADARKAWQQTAALRPPLPQLLAALEAWKRSDQWRRDNGRYIPYPATWLRGERWEDEVEIDLRPKGAAAEVYKRRQEQIEQASEQAAEANRAAAVRALQKPLQAVNSNPQQIGELPLFQKLRAAGGQST